MSKIPWSAMSAVPGSVVLRALIDPRLNQVDLLGSKWPGNPGRFKRLPTLRWFRAAFERENPIHQILDLRRIRYY
jgi:hypothetical protein